MPENPKQPRSSIPTKPPDTPVSPAQQFPSGDYSYTVELVGAIQNALGRLTEAVDSLKEQSKDHGKEIKEISKDLHAAKVTGRALLWVLAQWEQFLEYSWPHMPGSYLAFPASKGQPPTYRRKCPWKRLS